jgi:hypothetical protein
MKHPLRTNIITVGLFCTSLIFVISSCKNFLGTKQASIYHLPESASAQIPNQPTYPEALFPTALKDSPKPCQSVENLPGLHADSDHLLKNYRPKESTAMADITNYGERFTHDAFGNKLHNKPIVVLHETVISANETINAFQTPHPKDEDQASYHILIDKAGSIIDLVPLQKRAYGAGDSVFLSLNGSETVQTSPKRSPSVNNFAYHISLESPKDGRTENGIHSGYTDVQYDSLAWLIHKLNVPESRITTHYAVDRSGTRKDPRSFDFQKFFTLLHLSQRGCHA